MESQPVMASSSPPAPSIIFLCGKTLLSALLLLLLLLLLPPTFPETRQAMTSPDAGGRGGKLELVACIALVIVLLKFFLADWLVCLLLGVIEFFKERLAPDLPGDRKPNPTHGPAEAMSESDRESLPPGCEYEVFLSFRGPDTRESFADCLYNSLVDAGIRVFRDNEELRLGDEIGPRLRQGIMQSKISIPIFSKRYASSKWCLRELSLIAERYRENKQIVMPIFFDVTPDQVKNQTGNYDAALRQHAGKYPQCVGEWRSALSELGRLKGWPLKDTANGHWGQFIKLVVTRVLYKLKKAHLPMKKTFVGMERHADAVMSLLNVGIGDVRIVGIYGIRGIGKTTLAKDIYNRLLDGSEFEGCSSLDNIREKSLQPNGLEWLQSKLVADITRSKREDFGSVDEGTNMLMDRFRDKKVLILLDDVDHLKQLNALVAEREWFGLGSRIIITTTDGGILREAPQVDSSYEMEGMEQDEALELFNKHAFRSTDPSADPSTAKLNPLAKKIVKATGGLPLALEIIGSFLYSKNKDIWKETLEKLKERPDKKVLDQLRVSYDDLEDEEKEIFLDIACFFIGMDKRVVFHMWKDCKLNPALGIEVLRLRSLIKIGDDNRLWMHNCLRDLGRKIVEKEKKVMGMPSRLWRRDEARNILQNPKYKGTERIKAISLQCELGTSFCYDGEQFKNMSNLRFLRLVYAELSGDIRSLSELRWLSWQKSSLKFMPKSLPLAKLKVLDMSGSEVKEDWSAWSSTKKPVKLKVLDLSSCHKLTTTPDLSMFKHLERLILEDSQRLSAFHPTMVDHLQCLSSLNLKGCWRVTNLPERLGSMTKLMELIIDGTSIIQLPDSIGSLQNLQMLSANECHHLQALPDSIGRLNSLVKLSLSHTGVATLPNSVGNLNNMEVLNINSSNISHFPSSLGKLGKLKEINASKCKNLEGDIPAELGKLFSLEVLRLDGTNIKGIPETIRGLPHLQTLHLAGCPKLQSLPELPVSLVSVRVNSPSVEAIPNLCSLINLEELVLSINTLHCEIGSLTRLKVLSIPRCTKIQSLPKLPKSLHKLNISNSLLQILPELSELQNLTELSLENCEKLTNIPGLGYLVNLKSLKVDSCLQITSLSGLEQLKSLRVLQVSSCENLKRLPNLSMLKLSIMNARGCESLIEIEGLDNLYALTDLDIGNCKSIKRLPDLSKLTLLRSFYADGCKKLQGLEGIGKLGELLFLRISGCREIKCLPNLSKLKKLRHLDIAGCEGISEVHGLLELKSIKRIVISRRISLAKLQDILKERDANCDKSSVVNRIITECHNLWRDSRGCLSEAVGASSESINGLAVSISEGSAVAIYPYDNRRDIISAP
ncbi:TMV resistance protein N-like [Punica granatum]|uniref:TMV resistance protein N-like n=1 Tax=Punica granatum TaxID=22663 RepID=A0A6P8CFZ5_PUNGR|nr:TMV resistance protein N-like [Punica granatum]XP_031381360.1 TMV resistance protein N-like [Punica granatum]XP_031381361.1 TMV resistance protein N-like [Punica granatum]